MTLRPSLTALALLYASCVTAAELPDTQQEQCYDNVSIIPCPAPGQPFYGQDGNYHSTPRTFTKLDETGADLPDAALTWVMVRDNVTGLIWEVKTNDDGIHDKDNLYERCDTNPETNGGEVGTCDVVPDDYVSGDSEGFITLLNSEYFGGFSDWRMPTIHELKGLIHWGSFMPAINISYFPNTGRGCYLSSSADEGEWGTTLFEQNYDIGTEEGITACWNYSIRAVRGSTEPPIVMQDNNDTTVTDLTNGLMWQNELSGDYLTWQEALEHCENLVLAGYEDWHLPSINEALSLYNKHTLEQYGCSWTSTTSASKPVAAWKECYQTIYSDDYIFKINDSAIARCVRNTNVIPYSFHTLHLVIEEGGELQVINGSENLTCTSDCSYQIQKDTSISVLAVADIGASFSSWSDDCQSETNECLITMDSDKTVTATFSLNGDLNGDGRRGLEEVIMILQEQTGN